MESIKTPETNLKLSKRLKLSDKQPAKVWDTVDRILDKQHDSIKLHPSDINNHFTSLASLASDS